MSQIIEKQPFVVAVQETPAVQTSRLGAIDIVRGLAMIFMLLNHSTWHVPGITFRANFGWDIHVPPLPFLNPYMWVGLVQGTPLFFVMAGFGVALFEHSRRQKGWTEWQITRFLFIRGGLLIALDWLVLPWQFYPFSEHAPGTYFVLTAIGLCVWAVALLRLMPMRLLVVLIVVVSVAVQLAYKAVVLPLEVNLLRSVLLYMSPLDPIYLGFPALPWLCVILLGYVTMRYLNKHPENFSIVTLTVAAGAWCVWVVLVTFNDFGVLFPLHPLLMTKHPPSLAYLTFYIGLTYALLYVLHRNRTVQASFPFNRIALLGQTALAFYVLHFYVIDIFSAALENFSLDPFVAVLIIAALSLALLYVLCTRYRSLRKAHPNSLLQYL